MVDAGIVPTLLLTALLTTDSIECKLVCTKALLNLLMDDSCQASMVKDGLIWGFSSLALQASNAPNAESRSIHMEIKYLCALCLANLSKRFAKELLKLS